MFWPPTPYRARTLDEAYAQGMAMAVQALSRPAGGFQKEIKTHMKPF